MIAYLTCIYYYACIGKACEGDHLPACYRQAQMLYASINDNKNVKIDKSTLEVKIQLLFIEYIEILR